MQTEQMRLDGNAAGGSLLDLFAADVTTAVATCAGCGNERPMGALLEYGHGMGVILRCPGCGTMMLSIVRGRGFVRVDASGISLLAIPSD
jgi:DNA-directed RNA polymerase subunit RPC12/RpoP